MYHCWECELAGAIDNGNQLAIMGVLNVNGILRGCRSFFYSK